MTHGEKKVYGKPQLNSHLSIAYSSKEQTQPEEKTPRFIEKILLRDRKGLPITCYVEQVSEVITTKRSIRAVLSALQGKTGLLTPESLFTYLKLQLL